MSKGKLSVLIDAVQVIFQEICADHKAYSTLDVTKKSVHMNEARLADLERSFEEAKALHQKIVGAPTEEIKSKYMETLTFHNLKEEYFNYSCELKEHLAANDSQHALNKSLGASNSPSAELKLPAIKIPTFDGTLTLWPEFKNLFEAMVNNNTTISDAHKLQYLRSNLTGEAARILRNTDTNFEAAWALLVKRYQNIRLLKDNQFRLLFEQPELRTDSSENLKLLLDTTNEAKQSLKTLGVLVESWEDVLIYHTVQKLPLTTRALWESHIAAYADYPSYTVLEDFILMRSRTMDVMEQSSTTGNQPKPKRMQNSVRVHNSTTASKCSLCHGLHSIRNCFQFKALSTDKKHEIVKKNKLCFNCLSSAHFTQNCTSTYTCCMCNQKHHSLLHRSEVARAPRGTDIPPSHSHKSPAPSADKSKAMSSYSSDLSTGTTSAYNAFVVENNQVPVLLATACIKVLTPTGQPLLLRALLDPGSEASFITEAAAQFLQLEKHRNHVSIIGVGETNVNASNWKVKFTILSNTNKDFSLQISALVLKKLTSVLPTRKILQCDWSHIANLELADRDFNMPGRIDVLLGSDVYPYIILDGIIKGEPGTPMAQRTELGWVLSGRTSIGNQSQVTSFHITTETQTLDRLVSKFWELEEVKEGKLMSPEEEQCETQFCRTHQRQLDGKYMVQLPFKSGSYPSLGLSHRSALVRFLQLEKKFQANPNFHNEYRRVFNEYKELGHMTELSSTELKSPHYFVPHHAVLKTSSSTTKLRIVFDASCKTSDGTSLNDHLLIGPRLQDDIYDHIARFRKLKIAFTADINKMYRQIWVTPTDSLYQLVLWRDKDGEEIKTYRLNTVTFGTAAAPYLAIRTLQQLAVDERDDFPLASTIVRKNFYVDDVLHGGNSVEEALRMQEQLINMLRKGGFPLRKWASNCEKLLASVPEEDREVQVPLSIDKGAIKALGIQWHPAKDVFSFKISMQETKNITKRTILADIARLYDPMGWLAPCVIIGKVMMQDIWKQHLSWDSELPPIILSAWKKFKSELPRLSTIEIPRWINLTNESTVEVHGFCDASEKAYAAVLYLRITTGEETFVHLIASKTRVAPLKSKSLARLELCGALLLARLLEVTVNTMELQSAKRFMWCDSQIALAWIQGAPYIRTTFVCNRVAEIQELTNIKWWNYVPSKDNSADIASRGVNARELVKNSQWWYGPSFLQSFDVNHHESFQIKPTDLESKASKITVAKSKLIASGYPITNIFQLCVHFTTFHFNETLLTRFSSLNRLYRVTAYWRRYLHNLREKTKNVKTPMFGPLSVNEISSARLRLIALVQQEYFSEEVSKLSNRETISRKSKIARLLPFLDEDGVLRVGGRLENAELPYTQKHPIILPSSNVLTSLIVHDAHLKTLHGGQQLMMSTLRSEYWILKLKSSVKQCIHKCLRCYRYNSTLMQQTMGNLPTLRVNQARPFQTSGVDYAGPVQLKAWKGRCNKITKAYIAIFVCFCTKAVHLELVSDYTTSAFLAAFKRFTARRGICTNLYSDCGTNFKGAANILDAEKSFMSRQWSNDVACTLQSNGTQWHFNPPAAPHFGGLWEAGVKSMKHHLKRVVGHYSLTFEEYATVLTQVEACLNSRPLCPVSDDPDDLSILTPGHFLIGAALNTAPERDLTAMKESHLQRWQLLQKIHQDIWKRWKSEYLSRLQRRPKWLTATANIKVGQLVLLPEEQMPPTLWRLGRITETHPGTDGKIRVVTVKTATASFKRPIAKLSFLPMVN